MTQLTQEAMVLLLRDANAAFVVLNDAMSNSLEAHYELDLLAAADWLNLWRTFPTRAHPPLTSPPHLPLTSPSPRSPVAHGSSHPPLSLPPSPAPTGAHRLMDVQRGTQSLVAHAHAARSASSGGGGGEGRAVGSASLLLWPSLLTTTVRNAAAQIESLQGNLRQAQRGQRLLLQWLLARLSPEQMEHAASCGLLEAAAGVGDSRTVLEADDIVAMLEATSAAAPEPPIDADGGVDEGGEGGEGGEALEGAAADGRTAIAATSRTLGPLPPPPPPPPPPRSTGEGPSAETSAEAPQAAELPLMGRQSSMQVERLQGELLYVQEENRRLHALLAEAREGEGGASSRKKNPWFQQMLSSRRDEGDRRDEADAHGEEVPNTMGGDAGGEAPHVPSIERHCSTLDEYGAFERAAAFSETCAPDRYLFSVGYLLLAEPRVYSLPTTDYLLLTTDH